MKNCLGRPFWRSRLTPLDLSTFWPLFVFFFFCTEGENDILTMFLSYFLHSPLSPQKSIFLSFWRKIWQVLTKSLNALIELVCFYWLRDTRCDVFNTTILVGSHEVDLTHLQCSGFFKNCATRTVFDFIIRWGPVIYLTRRISNARCFLLLSTLSITSAALDPLWVSGRRLTRCGSEPMKVFRSCYRCFFLFAQQMCPLLLIAPLALNV